MLCPRCSEEIPAADVNLENLVAVCRRCDEVFSFADQVQHRRTKETAAPKLPAGPPEEEVTAPPDRSRRRSGGFPLVLVLCVVLTIVLAPIALVVAGLFAWSYLSYMERARESKAKLDITKIGQAVEVYELETDEYPENLQVLTQPLKGRPAMLESKDLQDPWGQPYVYEPLNRNPNTGRPRISSSHQTGGRPLSNW
jgi:hypothetical protein